MGEDTQDGGHERAEMLEHLRGLEVFMRRKRGEEGCWESSAERLFWSCGRNESSIYNHLVARHVMKAWGGWHALSSPRQHNLIRVCRDSFTVFSSEKFGKTYPFSCFLRGRFGFSSFQILACSIFKFNDLYAFCSFPNEESFFRPAKVLTPVANNQCKNCMIQVFLFSV